MPYTPPPVLDGSAVADAAVTDGSGSVDAGDLSAAVHDLARVDLTVPDLSPSCIAQGKQCTGVAGSCCGGLSCIYNACEPTACDTGDPHGCTSNGACCSELCVYACWDGTCRAAGTVCRFDLDCRSKSCNSSHICDPADLAGVETTCPIPSYTKCLGQCVDESVNVNACGNCGTACSSTQSCVTGHCQ